MLASNLYAMSEGKKNEGHWECHWCTAPCDSTFVHDDPPPIPFITRGKSNAKRPTMPYICIGCWLWRRKSLSIFSLSGKLLKDRETPSHHSWFITPGDARVITLDDFEILRQLLLAPPSRFSMIVKVEDPVEIHRAVANNNEAVTLGTQLHFTVDHVLHSWTPHGLEHAIRNGEQGADAGSRYLSKWLSPWNLPEKPEHHGGKAVLDNAKQLRKPVGK
jgi:hypothetical protein